jgi:hypothetical protein
MASIGVAVQSGIPGIFKNSQGDVNDRLEPDMSDRDLSVRLCGVKRVLRSRRRSKVCGVSSACGIGGALVSNEQEMDKT